MSRAYQPPFEFFSVPHLAFGEGVSLDLPARLASLSAQRPLLVTDRNLLACGLLSPIVEALRESQLEVRLFADVTEDPREAVVAAARSMAEASQCDSVVAVGGGSAMDVAKLVAVLLKHPTLQLRDLYGLNRVPSGRLPLILVPTTSGSGSESTLIAIIATDAGEKQAVSSAILQPDLGLLDPLLTLSVPAGITAATGMDALIHAIEAYTSRQKKNPLSDALALQAAKIIYEHLPRAVQDGGDRTARGALLLASNMAGQAFANAPVAAVHALAYPLAQRFSLSHGLSNALMLVPVLRYNLSCAARQYAELAQGLALSGRGAVEERAAAFLEAMVDLQQRLALPGSLAAVGVPEDALPDLAREALMQQRLLVNNPRNVAESDALAIYRDAWHGIGCAE